MSLPLVTHPHYSYEFEARHRFPMQKFRLLHQYLQATNIATQSNTFRPGRAKQSLLELAHCPEYLQQFIDGTLDKKAQRRMGLPWSDGLVRRTLISPAGTLLTCHLALQHGLACHLAGGTHHAHYDFASGYCILNDLAISALSLLQQKLVKNVLIFDLDVHQGDGTARILATHSAAFTCSVHCEKNFPARKASSDLDVNIEVGTSDDAYLSIVENSLLTALNLSHADFVIYDAGVDIYRDDPLGLIEVSEAGIRQRDRLVIETCLKRNIPLITVIGGGYDHDEMALAQRHAIAVEEAAICFRALR